MKFLTLAALAAAFSLAGFGQNQFHLTCSDAVLNSAKSGFDAVCKKRDGSPNKTSFAFPGLQNLDGKLTFTSGPTNYLESCDPNSIRLQVPSKAMTGIRVARITGFCKNKAGRSGPTSIDLNGLENIDGVLMMK